MKHQYTTPLWLIIAIAASIGCACSHSDRKIYPPQDITPLYEVLYSYASADSAARAAMATGNRPTLLAYMAVLGCPDYTDSLLRAVAQSRPVTVFTPDVVKEYPSVDSLEFYLGQILGAGRDARLSFTPRHYAAVVWGRPQSVVFVDSVMLIALNHYLGQSYPGYSSLPQYRRYVKSSRALPYDLAESLVANAYPQQPTASTTLLNHMLYDGAITTAKMQLIPDADLADALGYTPDQLQWLQDNESRIWQTLAAGRLLYETSEFKIGRIMQPAPATDLINPAAPGRAGRYIGYRIVEAYLKRHPETTLPRLLSPEFYNSDRTLPESAYSPK